MKLFIKCLALLGVLLLTASPTVKAGEKPDTSTHTLSVKIVPVAGGTWNYTNPQLFAAVHAAIPDFNPTFVELQNSVTHPFLNAGVYWLHFSGSLISTGKNGNVYFHLEKVGGWYVLDDTGIPTVGGSAWSCVGNCMHGSGDDEHNNGAYCRNTSSTVMVRCECDADTEGQSTDCTFQQYPMSTAATTVAVLKEMPPVVE